MHTWQPFMHTGGQQQLTLGNMQQVNNNCSGESQPQQQQQQLSNTGVAFGLGGIIDDVDMWMN